MTILDANAVLRCILQDNEENAALINNQMARAEFLLLPEIIAEIVYVLLKVYHVNRQTVVQAVTAITQHENAIIPNHHVVQAALRYFGETSLDFVDCLLIGHSLIDGHQIVTFDKELKKFW